ncbi:MAG: hypothetical protein HZB50_00065 [Chloroflexi bacterium]|nr:hypothetical protein [Chloroflexota bacterium]
MDPTIIVALIAGGFAIIVAIITGIFTLWKNKSDKPSKSSNPIISGNNIIMGNEHTNQTVNIFESVPQKEISPQGIGEFKSGNLQIRKDPDITEIPYSQFLGRQHKILREKYLKLTPREMADFYQFDKASTLEAYEAGDKEFSKAHITSTVNFFFVNHEFLEKGNKPVFKTELAIDSKSTQKLLSKNFLPFFLVEIKPQDWLYTYPIFHKSEKGFSRTISLNLCSFHYNSGSRYDIEQIIRLMIERNIGPYDAPVLKVTQEIWKSLQDEEFYCKDPYSLGHKDFDCQDILVEWYEKIQEKNRQE